ncbi:conserved hypothetical protein [Perkinsus marinus ATCC 50983]|uniref:MYND-type domain-containing protein n=1 Tax=Perkinsus marinus (strain ATCC 50983 / TXsc) TaxID=423536 RepID=C5KJ99_PERM5|nr:conserved hypothetical protein [Perkinsus marinus ATCC 50983]EER15401.1 conserved hypothetical protein [Perkinsus marinus ATCC 50983]|eukprot:XP_002783605.1 conserved hypothetical protein [Perkinsus marinus ATCC 50983]
MMNSLPTPMPVDLSDMDKIRSKEESSSEATTTTQEVVPKECSNCGKIPGNPLRCGICKKVVYCDRNCQKEDWRFHKRICKKPKAKKEKSRHEQDAERAAAAKRAAEPFRSKKDDDVVVEDEKLNWYRHREWIPEKKEEFKPHEIVPQQEASSPERIQVTDSGDGSHAGKSVWNTADTYEERNTTEWANDWLKQNIPGSTFNAPEGLDLVVDSIDNLEGDAAIPIVRGTARYVYDYKFKLSTNVTFKGIQLNADVKVDDFANDMEPYTFHVNVKDPKESVDRDTITAARSIIIKSIVPQLNSKLDQFVTEYHTL